MAEWTFTLNQLPDVARALKEQFSSPAVFAVHGEMGAGKTTFINAFCKLLQVSGTVSSPTFSIINEYAYPGGRVYHLDLYRLKTEEEAIRAGVEEVLYSGQYCFAEWPEQAPGLFPQNTIQLWFKVIDAQTRLLRVVDK